jgi:hypothetical protein
MTAVFIVGKCTGVITVFHNMYNGKGIQKKKEKDRSMEVNSYYL